MHNNILVKMENISKTFGKVTANKNINLDVKAGEVHSLLGENGAGKSTLMNILSGIYTPDSGSIFIKGNEVKITSPKASINLGIGMVHQHFKLVDVLTAKDNIIAGQKGSFFMKPKDLSNDIRDISKKYGLQINPDEKIYNMSVAEKQRVEILKVLYRGAKILILDEPTAVLTPQETQKLFDIVRKMKENGCAVIIITHKLNEVMEISDRITVLRKGECIKTVNKETTNPKELTDLMVGTSTNLSIDRIKTENKKIALEIKNITIHNDEKTKILDNISFNLCSGEILGVAGIAGSGQKELCEAIAGLQNISSGEIIFENENIVGKTPRDILKKGISMSFVPEDRLGMGLVASMDIVDNVLLKEYQNQKSLFLNKNSSYKKSNELVQKLNISTPSVHHPVRQLSGGNIQKVLLGREIECNPRLMITAYPARGLDIGAAHIVYDLLNEQKKKGVAILFIGEDLDVLLELCDKIMVICEGKVMGIVKAEECTKKDLGFMMAGESLEKGGISFD